VTLSAFLGFLFAGLGVVLLFWEKRAGNRRAGFAHWETAPGRVVSVRVIEAGEATAPRGGFDRLWTAEVTYSFSVDGVEHDGRQTRFRRIDAGDFDHAERVAASMSPGTPVEVAYDPSDPSRSVLAIDPPDRTTIGLGLVAIAIGAFLLMRGY